MKKNTLILVIVSLLFFLSGCNTDDRVRMSDNYPVDGDINYGIRQVMQYDEVNINGIDVASKFPFFETLRLTIHYTDSKISGVTFSNGEVPSGEVDCYLDTEALPNELRITGTEHVIAYYQNGEFTVPFQLDCPSLNYKYTFKSINQ